MYCRPAITTVSRSQIKSYTLWGNFLSKFQQPRTEDRRSYSKFANCVVPATRDFTTLDIASLSDQLLLCNRNSIARLIKQSRFRCNQSRAVQHQRKLAAPKYCAIHQPIPPRYLRVDHELGLKQSWLTGSTRVYVLLILLVRQPSDNVQHDLQR